MKSWEGKECDGVLYKRTNAPERSDRHDLRPREGARTGDTPGRAQRRQHNKTRSARRIKQLKGHKKLR